MKVSPEGALGQEIRASNDTHLLEMYYHARTLLPMAVTIGALPYLHGKMMSGLDFVVELSECCRQYISEPAEWPTHYTKTASLTERAHFNENLTRILEVMRRDLVIILKPVVATAKEYYDYLVARGCASPSSRSPVSAVSEQQDSGTSFLQGGGNVQR